MNWSRRHRGTVIAVVATLAVVGTMVVVAATRGHHAATSTEATPSVSPSVGPTALPAPAATAADGGQLRVVEQGFTQLHKSVTNTLTPGYGPKKPEPYAPVYLGIVVENTSRDEVALNPTIRVQYLDGTGKVLPEGWSGNGAAAGAGAIFPGQRVGLSAHFGIDATTVGRIDVTAVNAAWLRPAEVKRWASRLMATDVALLHTASPKANIVTFKAHSEYPGPVGATPFAVFRDASGKIIGASHIDSLQATSFPPGVADGSITFDGLGNSWLPANLDPARIEVYFTKVTFVPR
jgi:hypothetical protein